MTMPNSLITDSFKAGRKPQVSASHTSRQLIIPNTLRRTTRAGFTIFDDEDEALEHVTSKSQAAQEDVSRLLNSSDSVSNKSITAPNHETFSWHLFLAYYQKSSKVWCRQPSTLIMHQRKKP
jgi:hypothetical protein